jgi:hypothetical protein
MSAPKVSVSSDKQVQTEAISATVGFAFSVIGVFLIVCAVEALRHTARDYDHMLVTQRKVKANNNTSINP